MASIQANMTGARLAFVVRELEGTVRRQVHKFTKTKGLVTSYVEEPAGYMVYFPRGHAIRLNKEQLRHYKLNMAPRIVNLDGLNDPNSPLGKLFLSQDQAIREQAMVNLEEHVIQLAQAKAGRVEVVRDASDLEEEAA